VRRIVVIFGLLGMASAAGTAFAGAAGFAGGPYVTQMRVPGQELSTSLRSIPDVTALGLRYPVRPTAAREAATKLTTVRLTLSDATRRLREITPPVAIATFHADLKQGAAELETELGPIIAGLKKGYLTELSKLPSLRGVAEVEVGLRALKAHGYSIGGV
jgi:hypothetical protein